MRRGRADEAAVAIVGTACDAVLGVHEGTHDAQASRGRTHLSVSDAEASDTSSRTVTPVCRGSPTCGAAVTAASSDAVRPRYLSEVLVTVPPQSGPFPPREGGGPHFPQPSSAAHQAQQPPVLGAAPRPGGPAHPLGPAGGPPPPPGPAGPPAAPAGPPPGTDLGADLGAAFRWMWVTFSRNLAAFLVPGAVYGVVTIGLAVVMMVVMFGVMGVSVYSVQDTDGPEAVWGILGSYLVVIPFLPVFAVVGALWSTGAVNAGSIVLAGGRPTIGQGFAGPWRMILTFVLVQVLAFVGVLLCYLPGIVFAVFATYALSASARGASPVEALKESFRLARRQLGLTIVGVLVIGVAASFASYLVVTVIAIPALTGLATLALFERASGRALHDPVAA